MQTLEILADAAKYDAACTSSGLDRSARKGSLGSTSAAGCCHSFTADGRCVSLLKVLFTNRCCFDCAYCINRRSNDIPRTSFTPRQLADLTIAFYKRNYIEGLFLSSAVERNPDYTMEQMIETIRILREEYDFRGYIHAKSIPGASDAAVEELGFLVDRISVNIELPSQGSLMRLAPDKGKASLLEPMRLISNGIEGGVGSTALSRRNKLGRSRRFAPAGQSTQMIIGATPESDKQILTLTESLYGHFGLKRVFFSAYQPINTGPLLPERGTEIPLTREHRLYQADWLLRFYGFEVSELFDRNDSLEMEVDPKASWALSHPEFFPVEVNSASKEELLRVPGLGVTTAHRIVQARRHHFLNFDDLRTLGLSLKRAGWFISCRGRIADGFSIDMRSARMQFEESTRKSGAGRKNKRGLCEGQLPLFDDVAAQAAQDPFSILSQGDRLLKAASRSASIIDLEPSNAYAGKALSEKRALPEKGKASA